MKIAHVAGMEDIQLGGGAFMVFDDIKALFRAADDETVSLLDDREDAINSLTTSSALSADGDPASSPCAIDEGTNQPTPGSSNACVGN